MEICVVDTYKTTLKRLKADYPDIGNYHFFKIDQKKNFNQIAEELVAKGYDTIFINIEAKYDGDNISELKGIELIFWLRLKYNFKGSIITYGFLSAAQILRLYPDKIIIYSPNVYHCRLPLDINKLKSILSYKVKSIKKEYLVNYIRPAFNLAEFRHQEANWWGMKSLIDIHRSLYCDVPYPQIVNKNLNTLNNLISIYLFGLQNDSFSITPLKDSFRKKPPKRNFLLIDDLGKFGWGEVFNTIFQSENIFFHNINIDFQDNSLTLDSIIFIVSNYLSKNKAIDGIILDLRLLSSDNTTSPEFYTGVEILKLLKKEYPEFPVLITSASNKLWTYRVCVKYGVDAYWIKSGIDNMLSKKDLLNSYKRLKRIVLSFNNEEFRLKRDLIKITKEIKQGRKQWWRSPNWGNIEVKLRGVTATLRTSWISEKLLLKSYNAIIHSYSLYIHDKYIKDIEISDKSIQFNFSAIITEIGKIIEAIHPTFRKNNVIFSTGFNALQRGDKIGAEVYKIRNQFAAHKNKTGIKEIDFILFVKKFNEYILSGSVLQDVKIAEKIKKHVAIESSKQLKNTIKIIEQNKINDPYLIQIYDEDKLDSLGKVLELDDKIEKAEIFLKKQ